MECADASLKFHNDVVSFFHKIAPRHLRAAPPPPPHVVPEDMWEEERE